jgi:hypothetical protein
MITMPRRRARDSSATRRPGDMILHGHDVAGADVRAGQQVEGLLGTARDHHLPVVGDHASGAGDPAGQRDAQLDLAARVAVGPVVLVDRPAQIPLPLGRGEQSRVRRPRAQVMRDLSRPPGRRPDGGRHLDGWGPPAMDTSDTTVPPPRRPSR